MTIRPEIQKLYNIFYDDLGNVVHKYSRLYYDNCVLKYVYKETYKDFELCFQEVIIDGYRVDLNLSKEEATLLNNLYTKILSTICIEKELENYQILKSFVNKYA